ncbi:hypothetical protein A3G63_03325 [Candidatus Kaiserbacteria bacterium RIFCSPLOWO2_12_FULL_52_8]|uniref:Uncharacterized protein n=1 Tax=Candidatus Kaiserbacteria bacterium RIFCSPHIGHO2_01_FULL_53_31 TaxID=1798481 RepID=A0A1F6CHA5_9BACT|nr:MAG: hypothetical protein A2678_03595 [Candidatus Kaiserbacteria bacterium RIFCSPHIGHO2_01_FULL_53_31]OGG92531.1 MAG: hypothetical protein A3G63_03325 [Candidatus Kaiserbacteria bacterium RIFCSPLOWO2_12_FULL_52_8]
MPPQSSVLVQSRRSLETWSVWALVATLAAALVAVTPFLSVSLITTKTFILAAGTILTLALYILARLSRGNVVLPPFALVGALWLPVIAYALSSAFSGTPLAIALWGSSLEPDTLGLMLVVACLGTLTALVLRRAEQYRSFLSAGASVFVLIAVIQAAIIIIGQFSPATVSPAFSIVGSFEDLAFLLGLGVTCALITFRFHELGLRARRILIVVTVVSLVLLAIANSSFVWVILALVSLGLFIETIMMRGPKPDDADLDDVAVMEESLLESETTRHPIVLPLAVLAVSLFFLVGGQLGGALASALHVNVLSVTPSWQSTLAVAEQTYATSPVFGTGPGTFGVEWLKYRDVSLNSTIFWNVDFSSGIGFIPTSLVTTGLVGAIAWLAFLVLFIVFGLRTLIARTPEDAFIRYVAILSFVALVYLFGAAIFKLPNAVILALAFVFAGLFASTTRFGTRARQWGVIFSRSPRLGFVIVFSLTLLLLSSIVVAYTLVERYIATTELASANIEFAAGDLTAAGQSVQNAISFAPSSAAYVAEADIALVRLRQIAASTTMPATAAQQAFQTELSSGINAALTATRLAPSDYQSWLALGNLYSQAVPLSVSGAYESAKTAYDKAKALNPTNPEILYIIAQLDIAHKDSKAAKDDLKAAIALKQDYTTAIFLLSQLEVQEGNVKGALDAALAAAYFAPNDPNILFQVGVLRAAQGDLPGASEALSGAVTSNPQFANARYFLAAVYAKQGNNQGALEQLKLVSSLSSENASTVAPLIASLETGKNPFPANLLSMSPSPGVEQ